MDTLSHLTLVLGGTRSGKSLRGEQLVTAVPAPWIYVATAEAYDAEMRERIAIHRARRSEGWTTVDAPLALGDAVRAAPQDTPVLVDCLTLWLSNLMLGDHDFGSAIDDLESALSKRETTTVLVSNEVGLSVVPDNALARSFRDEQGRLNQRIAARAQSVIFMVAGLPMTVKGEK